MKKLFYIVLVIVALMVISRLVKENNSTNANNSAIETSDPVTATLPDTNCICDSQPSCDPQNNDCDTEALKTICRCTQANGETITIEQNVEEVVETNPDETSDEDETFVEDTVDIEETAPQASQEITTPDTSKTK